jgi:hypothetical protein
MAAKNKHISGYDLQNAFGAHIRAAGRGFQGIDRIPALLLRM